jgi:hypothetical protein
LKCPKDKKHKEEVDKYYKKFQASLLENVISLKFDLLNPKLDLEKKKM